MIYVTSDIHGEFDSFKKLLNKINFNSSEDNLYILGDVVDRGYESIKALKYIKDNEAIVLLKGNHEDMMIEAVATNYLHSWFRNGGHTTYEEFIELPSLEQKELLKYMIDLPCVKQVEVKGQKFILSHAGVEADEHGRILEEQDQDFLLWARDEFLYDTKIEDDVIAIVGHTPTVNIHNDDTIWHSDCTKKICVDCGKVFGYKLGCLRLDDMKEFYI